MDDDKLPPGHKRANIAEIDQQATCHGARQIQLLPALPSPQPNLTRARPDRTASQRREQSVARITHLQTPCDFNRKPLHPGERLDGETAIDEQTQGVIRPARAEYAAGAICRRGMASCCARAVAATSAASSR